MANEGGRRPGRCICFRKWSWTSWEPKQLRKRTTKVRRNCKDLKRFAHREILIGTCSGKHTGPKQAPPKWNQSDAWLPQAHHTAPNSQGIHCNMIKKSIFSSRNCHLQSKHLTCLKSQAQWDATTSKQNNLHFRTHSKDTDRNTEISSSQHAKKFTSGIQTHVQRRRKINP